MVILSWSCGVFQNIEVMRAHRTNVNQRATEANTPTVRPIHIYLLRYSDKVQILKVAANALKNNLFLDCQIFISDDVLAQILFKDRNCSKLKSFKLPDE